MDELLPEYLTLKEASDYLRTTTRKISLFRQYGLLKSVRYGKAFVYKRSWLDEFSETWSDTDLSNESKIRLAINARKWHETHDKN